MWLEFYSVNQYLVAKLMVAGANGELGLSVHFFVEEESHSGGVSVTIQYLRVVGGAAKELCNNRKTATHTCAQVVQLYQVHAEQL